MFCSNCGADIPDDTQFCPNCGATQKSEEKVTAAQACDKKPLPVKMIVGVVAVLVVLSKQYFILLKDYKARYLGVGKVDNATKIFYEDLTPEQRKKVKIDDDDE